METKTRHFQPLRVGVTGGIGAGKSAVIEEFRAAGHPVFDADAVVRELYSDPAVVAAVSERFGRDIVAADGQTVDRAAIAAIVFDRDSERRWLEHLLHPRVADAWQQFVAQHTRDALVVAEVPLLFEAGLEDRYDVTIAVQASPAVRVARVAARDAATDEQVRARMRTQLSDEERAKRADIVLCNEGDVDELRRAARSVMDGLLEGRWSAPGTRIDPRPPR